MKVAIYEDEDYPVYYPEVLSESDIAAGYGEGRTVDIPDDEWAEYQDVMGKYYEWQRKLDQMMQEAERGSKTS